MKRVFLMLGGLYSFDGYITSAGMFGLANDLRMPDTDVKTYPWASYRLAANEIVRVVQEQKGDKIVLIGYSGGGWRATTIANTILGTRIDLMVLYDPSPSWNMETIGSNVKRAVCYQNARKMFIPLVGFIGGGTLTARQQDKPPIEIVPIAQQHLAVQFNTTLHNRTIDLVKHL